MNTNTKEYNHSTSGIGCSIGIIGLGPIGIILAAHLAKSGHPVYGVEVNSSTARILDENGIHVSGLTNISSRLFSVFSDTHYLSNLNLDYIFICVKANYIRNVMPILIQCITPHTQIISMQNGIDTEDEIASHINPDKVFRIIVNFAGNKLSPNRVDMTFFNRPNYIGAMTAPSYAGATTIAEFLTQAGLETQSIKDYRKQVWRKAMLNSSIMPVSVITGLTMVEIMQCSETRLIVEHLMIELLNIARMQGYIFEESFFENAMAYLENAGPHKTSMLCDFESGQSLEIGYLNQKFSEYADKLGVLDATNKLMIYLILGMLKKNNQKAKAMTYVH